MPLQTLYCGKTKVFSLAPLQGMPLTQLSFHSTKVSDLSPLEGMRLTKLVCNHTPVSDLSPLANMRTLRALKVDHAGVTPAKVATLQKALPDCKIEWDEVPETSPSGAGAQPRTPEPAAAGTK
jgi:hypothetical protein